MMIPGWAQPKTIPIPAYCLACWLNHQLHPFFASSLHWLAVALVVLLLLGLNGLFSISYACHFVMHTVLISHGFNLHIMYFTWYIKVNIK